MTCQVFGAHPQQSALPPQGHPGQYPSYGFGPGGVLTWDWGNSIEFPDYSSRYEPQGELAQELHDPNIPADDFSIPLPVTIAETVYSPQPYPSAPPTIIQNPLSPPPKPPRRPSIPTGMTAKRKAESEQRPAKRPNTSRTSSSASIASPVVTAATASESHPPASMAASAPAPAATETATQTGANTTAEAQRRKEPSKGTGPQGRVIDVSRPRRVVESMAGQPILPAGKVFPIQIGSELFRLSGASISSDAPSYFSQFFGEQIHNNQGRAGDIKTLYIDRDPHTFRDIAAHLQGYHITPKDGEHYVRLFADAQFYSLPRLMKQLFNTDIFIRIGGVPFQIPRDLFSSPGDSPNYFSLGFAQFFSTPSEVFPGLDRNALLRPPSISPPSVPNRSGETFKELVKILQGYNVNIRNEAHRAELLRDARYFHLKGLEQKLIPCQISYNLRRNQSEILIRLEDIRQSGVSFTPDPPSPSTSASTSAPPHPEPSDTANSTGPALGGGVGGPQFIPGTVSYARPYTDDHSKTPILILEISSNESTTLHLPPSAPSPSSSPHTLHLHASFHGTTLARISSLFSVIAAKMGLPATQPLGLMLLHSGAGVAAQPVSPANSGLSEKRVRVGVSEVCALVVDGVDAVVGVDVESGCLGVRRVGAEGERGRDGWIWGGGRVGDGNSSMHGEMEDVIVVKRAHWKVRVELVGGEGEGVGAGVGVERRMRVVLCGVKIEGFMGERCRNADRGFLGG
ncbi:hypothetical protein P280DRAFT_396963 [Massarina eburnea CBS 473.64]|uniref:Potassium channel tetramerisation-type BTB domain-containing protein n=1 Tax=Massarina eburnea CBS 473.64 TaxID=1395130 RepID=A0A6A6S4S8_9PLEO|nr:hypothetical protein P280DRAFT_396963 [Massarina eburnea CBS 473.64]